MTTSTTPSTSDRIDHAVDRVVDTHLAAYCEPDPARRAELVREVWASDGTIVDPPMDARGHDAIAALTDVVLQHYPGHRFRRTTAIDAHHDVARYGWELVGADGAVAVSGIDVVRLADDGTIREIVGFFGDLPARDG